MASLELKGVVGASIAAEVSLGIEVKEGQLSQAKGKRTRKRGKRRAENVQVYGSEEKMVVAGADVGLNAFAGAKADAELEGAIQWRNPEDKKKSFEGFAEIAPTVRDLDRNIGTVKQGNREIEQDLVKLESTKGIKAWLKKLRRRPVADDFDGMRF